MLLRHSATSGLQVFGGKNDETDRARNLELLKLSFTFVFQFRSTRVFVGKGNELPGPVFQRTFQNVGVFVASEQTKITRLLAVPPVYTGLYLYGPGAQRKTRRTFVALCVGL